MEVSDVWVLFGSYIHQDFVIDHPDFLSGIAQVLENFSPQQKDELHTLLTELCYGDHTPKEKMDFWEKSGASFFVAPQETSDFLRDVLEVVARSRVN